MLAMKQRVYLAVYVCATRHTWWFSLAGCNLYYADAIFLLVFVVTLNHSSQYSICTQHHTCNTTRHSKLCALVVHQHTNTHTDTLRSAQQAVCCSGEGHHWFLCTSVRPHTQPMLYSLTSTTCFFLSATRCTFPGLLWRITFSCLRCLEASMALRSLLCLYTRRGT